MQASSLTKMINKEQKLLLLLEEFGKVYQHMHQ